ncbi:MAG: tellurite resistance TerB family protein [Thalassobaculales bacterium]
MSNSTIGHHAALIYTMVMMSGADGGMTDAELATIGDIVTHLPIFEDFDPDRLTSVCADCAAILAEPDGFQTALDLIASALPEPLNETGYALACDVLAADRRLKAEELRLRELLRRALGVGKLAAAAIERAARARYHRLRR